MEVHFTARRFRARKEVRTDAIASVKKLDKYYDGVRRVNIILSYERSSQSLKAAEINLHVFGTILSAKEKSEDFQKSIGLALQKIERQLAKYKTRLHTKNKKTLRRMKEDIIERTLEDQE